MSLALGDECVEARGAVDAGDLRGVERDQGRPAVRQRGADASGRLAVFDEDELRRAVGEDERELVLGRGREHRDDDRSGVEDAEVGDQPFHPVFRQDDDPVAAAGASVAERERDGRSAAMHLVQH